ncbi:MAG: hypothetical protein AAF367_17305 [Pseudomonadota bacterium]
MRWVYTWFFAAPVFGLVAAYAIAPGMLNLYLLWFSYANDLPIARGDVIFALNGLAMSLLPFCFFVIPFARHWLFAERAALIMEGLFWLIRWGVGSYILYRCQKKFEVVPVPEGLSFLISDTTLSAVSLALFVATLFPQRYLGVAHEQAKARKAADPPVDMSAGDTERGLVNNPLARAARQDAVRRPADVAAEQRRKTQSPAITLKWRLRLRWFIYGFLALTVVLGIYGAQVPQFIVDDAAFQVSPAILLPILVISGLCGLLVAIRMLAHMIAMTGYPIVIVWFFGGMVIAMPVFAAVLAWGAVSTALPALHSYVALDRVPDVIEVPVSGIKSAGSLGGCNYRAILSREDDEPYQTICLPSQDVFYGLQNGGSVRLSGYRTRFGFRYERVSLAGGRS